MDTEGERWIQRKKEGYREGEIGIEREKEGYRGKKRDIEG